MRSRESQICSKLLILCVVFWISSFVGLNTLSSEKTASRESKSDLNLLSVYNKETVFGNLSIQVCFEPCCTKSYDFVEYRICVVK